jgi:hypothetical protein
MTTLRLTGLPLYQFPLLLMRLFPHRASHRLAQKMSVRRQIQSSILHSLRLDLPQWMSVLLLLGQCSLTLTIRCCRYSEHFLSRCYDQLSRLSVLESVGGDQDRAIDALLGMSDPDYKSEARPQPPVGAHIPLVLRLFDLVVVSE